MTVYFTKYQRDNGSSFISVGVKVIIDGIQYGITEHIDLETFESMVEDLRKSKGTIVLYHTEEEINGN